MFFIKKLKAHFAQGENNKRYKVLKAITEAVHAEYTEDNYNTRISWLVEEILRSDPEFGTTLKTMGDIKTLEKALENTVRKVWCQVGESE